MSFETGARLGPYQITARLGEGGISDAMAGPDRARGRVILRV